MGRFIIAVLVVGYVCGLEAGCLWGHHSTAVWEGDIERETGVKVYDGKTQDK